LPPTPPATPPNSIASSSTTTWPSQETDKSVRFRCDLCAKVPI
jgi:hypothetical protein